jgi:hypothetical protein
MEREVRAVQREEARGRAGTRNQLTPVPVFGGKNLAVEVRDSQPSSTPE